MGQHKYNPTAQAAKEGKLPPKPAPMSRAELRRQMISFIQAKTGADVLIGMTHGKTLPEPPKCMTMLRDKEL